MVNEMRRVDVGLDEANELLNQAGLQSVDSMEILQGGWDNTCLLYTSPSPRDAHESRMPSSA